MYGTAETFTELQFSAERSVRSDSGDDDVRVRTEYIMKGMG